MTAEGWQRVKELLAEALECAPAERAEFVKKACAGDNALQAEIESLLAEENVLGDFLNGSVISRETSFATGDFENVSSQAGRALPATIGDYRIIDLIGEGGMAVVYKAEQQQPRRIVALKIIKPGLAGREHELRFEREKKALARLQHPGIARIYDAGTADTGHGPQPYFAMEFIEQGQPLTSHATSKRLTVRPRLELMAQICDAVQHAHQHFIIHRDLKPNNILIDQNGQPKVLDFGVARITDGDIEATGQTDLGQVIGTLDYMSPEQAQGDPNELDPRSDVYALGVILHELLAGKRPYDLHSQGYIEALRAIREQEPARLGSLKREYRGDIETIVAKCLEKDKLRRYGSAAEVAADIRRYLGEEPIIARRDSVTYQLQKFARRNKAIVGGIASVIVVLAIGVVTTVWQARRASDKAVQAEARELAAWAVGSLDDDPERSLILGLYSWGKKREMAPGLDQLLHNAVLRSRVELTLRGHLSGVTSIAWSPDGSKLATAAEDNTAKVWDAGTGQELVTLRGHQSGVGSIAWSPDGTKLATASADNAAKVWDAGTGQELVTLRGHHSDVRSIAWSPNGTKLATASADKTARVWDVSTGRELLTLSSDQEVASIAWSPDGSELATTNRDTARIWEVSTGRELLALHQGFIISIAWSPDGSKVATASFDQTAKVWDARAGGELLTLRGHRGGVVGLAWSPDGDRLATASVDRTAKVWDATTGSELLSFNGHQRTVTGVAWSPDGSRLATASLDRTAKVWQAGPVHELLMLSDLSYCIAWSPDGRLLASENIADATVKVWDVRTGRQLLRLGGQKNAKGTGLPGISSMLAWSPDGSELAATNLDRTAKIWDASTGRELLSLNGPVAIAWSPDGTKLATVSLEQPGKVWDARTGRELLTLHGSQSYVFSVTWSPDGSKLATGSLDHGAKVWDAGTGRELLSLPGESEMGVSWSADGGRLASRGQDGNADVWDARSGRKLLTFSGLADAFFGVLWSPDGSRLAAASLDPATKVWDAATGREVLALQGHQSAVLSIAWSPDGTKLADAGDDKVVQIFAIDPVLLVRLVRSRITRFLTPEECRQYFNADQCPPLPNVP